MMNINPVEKIKQAAFARIGAAIEGRAEDGPGDSPIERILFSAIEAAAVYSEFNFLQIAHSPAEAVSIMEADQKGPRILVECQRMFCGARVDFLVHAYGYSARVPGALRVLTWRHLVVECDGHAFHERTKEQAARDRSRDRAFQEGGAQVFRFTGSEIFNDPVKCADAILDWAYRGMA
jgi:hypothetical protein